MSKRGEDMDVKYKLIPKGDNNPARRITPDTIVIHYSGDSGVSADRLALCLYNNNANNVSANYCVDDKDIICTIQPGFMSYGVTGHNSHIINIEVCYDDPAGRFELDTIANLRRIVKYLMREFRIPAEKVVRHFDLTGKKCPWYYVDNPREWARLHKIITKGVIL